ncbi:MAG: 16S rRNA (adenine(1518)-N(6)/adenine(1519)-N(6))-dimethyltransferase RsmA [Geminicoccaceae bacterium]|nr:16S rRNA (adenine(1518)-N(6)/adenine(1519)-N(6))-dimethyltransferase RsmA [Geminicoccaceae bacterium]
MADALARLPPLTEVIRRHGLAADKRLGQHFLLDPGILGRIALAAGPLSEATVLEVGPGPGGLTRALLAAGAARVVAVERDPRCLVALAELAAAAAGRLLLVEADARTFSIEGLAPPGALVIVANLPYNIGTELLLGWLRKADAIARMVLLFQKEVALRLVAAPGSAEYGRLSVLAQLVCRVERLFDLAPGAFSPPPKVTSSLVRLVPRPDRPPAELLARVERLTAAAFGRRRKMLRQSLKPLWPEPEPVLAGLGIPGSARAEDLTPETFRRLALLLPAGGDQPSPEPVRNCWTNSERKG